MKKISLTLLTTFIISTLWAQDECYQVLRLASRNYTDTQTQSVLAQKIYKEYTKNFSSSNSTTIGMDLGRTAKLIQESFGIKGSTNSETIQQFRSKYESGFFSQSDYSSKTNIVVEEAIRAWEECQRLRNSDVSFGVADGTQHITFSMKQSSGKTINLTGVYYDSKCMECYISDSKKTVLADKNSRAKISEGKVLNLTCKRIKTVTDSTTFYPNADISINTDLGNLTIPIPEKIAPTFRWLSDVSSELSNLEAKIDLNSNKITESIGLAEKNLNDYKAISNISFITNNDILLGYYTGYSGPNKSGIYYKSKKILTSEKDKREGVMWINLNGEVGAIDAKSKYRIFNIEGGSTDYLVTCKKDEGHKELKISSQDQVILMAIRMK